MSLKNGLTPEVVSKIYRILQRSIHNSSAGSLALFLCQMHDPVETMYTYIHLKKPGSKIKDFVGHGLHVSSTRTVMGQ